MESRVFGYPSLGACLAIAGCQGVDWNERDFSGYGLPAAQSEMSCAKASPRLDSAAQPGAARIGAERLPNGEYALSASEFAIEDPVDGSPDSANTTRLQYSAVPRDAASADGPDPILSRICFEPAVRFASFSGSLTVPADFLRESGDRITAHSSEFLIEVPSVTRPAVTVRDGGTVGPFGYVDFAGALASYWNGGYSFAALSDRTYAFFGTRYENGGRVFRAKSVYRFIPPRNP